jgi:hypothetical protein
VEQRCDVQRGALVDHELACGQGAESGRNEVAVAEHCSFGVPGGAAGVEDASELVIGGADVGSGLGRGDEVLGCDHADGEPAVSDEHRGRQGRALITQRGHGTGVGVVHDQDAGAYLSLAIE